MDFSVGQNSEYNFCGSIIKQGTDVIITMKRIGNKLTQTKSLFHSSRIKFSDRTFSANDNLAYLRNNDILFFINISVTNTSFLKKYYAVKSFKKKKTRNKYYNLYKKWIKTFCKQIENYCLLNNEKITLARFTQSNIAKCLIKHNKQAMFNIDATEIIGYVIIEINEGNTGHINNAIHTRPKLKKYIDKLNPFYSINLYKNKDRYNWIPITENNPFKKITALIKNIQNEIQSYFAILNNNTQYQEIF